MPLVVLVGRGLLRVEGEDGRDLPRAWSWSRVRRGRAFVGCPANCPRVISTAGVWVGRIPAIRTLSGPSSTIART
ncbi:hypothetical protein [Streptomyces globisporus]|uniref:hypothetical protein n=1 Tax=Streptomyces globisporus TaxID=1908 RepID=UPI00382E54A7